MQRAWAAGRTASSSARSQTSSGAGSSRPPNRASQKTIAKSALTIRRFAVPVYWLGLEFAPEGFPKLELYRGDNLGGGHGPGAEVKINSTGAKSSTTLDLWEPEGWEQFKKTRLGR